MRILVGCERSGRVRDAFRRRGHDAWSCDLEPDFYGKDKYHLQMDVFKAIRSREWDQAHFFPPCTDLSVACANLWPLKAADGRQRAAAEFFELLYNCKIGHVSVENPIGWMNTNWDKPDQIIEPWMFGEPFHKKTCLWLRGLPLLVPEITVKPAKTRVVVSSSNASRPGYESSNLYEERYGRANRAFARGETFAGIANAMASQWGRRSAWI